ncbi:MbtH family NRPS accessory protein [Dactylosporangium sp. AC04546]|uniref:MbtH family protein n=1 Tax=Dactylosporangium sp. AC04546 TaxID=2862460 RepID=UPI001EDE9AE8|nr:MbtH family NRPS accessory protein [Dactylosporangium sp. AC04546]WVK88764.1 MbtH family NRPS accessory protein [Dactylosporangium sp. AC04546]
MADPGPTFTVVVSDEGAFSLWAAAAAPPPGWQRTGAEGTEAQCLAWIAREWTDMRPRSVRDAMAAAAGRPGGRADG